MIHEVKRPKLLKSLFVDPCSEFKKAMTIMIYLGF
jgi:hypothetical protein